MPGDWRQVLARIPPPCRRTLKKARRINPEKRTWRSVVWLIVLLGLAGTLRGEIPSRDPADSIAKAGTADAGANPKSDKKTSTVYPAIQNIRSDEDWSILRGRPRNSFHERIKFVPLNNSGAVFLSVGGQLRLRGESWRNFGFGGPGIRDDSFSLARLRLHADLWLGSRARVFVEAKSALAAGRRLPGGFRTLDVDSLELQNGHLDLRLGEGEAVTFRLGRQEMQFGKQRLVSPLDWSNTRRSFDGVRVTTRTASWKIDAFWTKYDVIHKYSFNRPGESGLDLYGLHGTSPTTPIGKIDIYWFGTDRDRATWGGVTADERRHTFGGRLWGGSKAGWDWELETALQIGHHGPRDVRAWMATGEVGHAWPQSRFEPRLSAGLDYASGDRDPGDDVVNTFDQILPLGHAYLGYIDFVGRQNIIDWRQEIGIDLGRHWTATAASHFFWLDNPADALYNAGAGIVRSGRPEAARRVGSEIDFTAGHAFSRFLRWDLGYCHFWAGPFIRATGPGESIGFFYLSIQTTF